VTIVQYLRYRLRTLRNMTVVHIGAHQGKEAKAYNAMLARKVFWIEANPRTFERLQENMKQYRSASPGIIRRFLRTELTEHHCINALVTDRDNDEHEFFQYNNGGASDSVFHLSVDSPFTSLKETDEVLHLKSNTLDTLLRNAGQDPAEVDVVVLDTQGAELLCLAGATETLKNVQYIETEVSTEPVYQHGVLYHELRPWLEERGFIAKTKPSRSHCDVIFARDSIRRAA